MQPISSRNLNLYKGPSGSKEFNSIRNDLHHDLYTLFNIANSHEDKIKENMDVLIRENFFLQNRLSMLEQELEQAKINLRFKEQGLRREKDIQSFYTTDNIILIEGDTHRTNIDTSYGIATIDVADHVSKVSYKGEDGKVIVPHTLEATLYESNDSREFLDSTGLRDFYEVEDVDMTAVFDQDKNTFWTRTVTFPNEKSVTEVYGILHVKLPIDRLNDIHTNTVTINPYPEYSMDILDIQYKGYGDQWFRLPNYPIEQDEAGEDVPVAIKEAGKLIFTFPKREVTEMQIHFKQPYWFKSNAGRDFVYGFQNINVENRVYNSDEAQFITEFKLESGTENTKSFEMIRLPVVTPSVGSEGKVDDLVVHKLFFDRSLTNEGTFGSHIGGEYDKVYVKTTLVRMGDIVPVIKDIQLDYDYKDNQQAE